jgi:FKBP-type peptidyl-prolyl cis-trans isomerase SlyD
MVVTIDYTLKNNKGEIIDSSEKSGTLTYLHGFKNIIEGLEEALEGKNAGDSFSVSVSPDKGYGLRDSNMVFTVPADNFKNVEGDALKPGMEFETVINDAPCILTVLEAKGNKVKVDANHPLAGKPLFFDVKVIDIRDSYSDELAQGYPIKE